MDICYLKGVGQKRAEQMAKLGIFSVQELLNFYPRDYIDFSMPYPVAEAPFDLKCVVKATVYGKNSHRISGGREIHKVMCGDETSALTLIFFNNPYAPKKLEIDNEYYFFGKVGGNLTVREMSNPVILSAEIASETPFLAIYHQTQGITGTYISKCVKTALNYKDELLDPLPQYMLEKYKLADKITALKNIHFPKNMNEVQNARRRLIFEELLTLQLGLALLRSRNKSGKTSFAIMQNSDISNFILNLPFSPTGAQMRCINEIIKDFSNETPMNRLLQGDVGSGKTLVAAAGIFVAAQNNFQSVLMAPTEILATQHEQTLKNILGPLGIKIALLTGSVKGKAKNAVLKQIKEGEVDVIVGTHAVLSDGVEYKNLVFAITDEQHRFGVRQRNKLAEKGKNPHLLVMSATPIPRTLALLMFGDLDISVIDEMPPGRTKTKTYAITSKKRMDMYGFLKQQLQSGRQAYIVCPLIDENDDTDMQAVNTYYEQVAKPLLQGYEVGLMHGKLKAAQKAQVMEDFVQNKTQVLVSTTVIEVGVDVKNANIIVIENAERYGLSALHQLRGRVGRGEFASHCILISDNLNESTKARLSFLCNNTNGFEIAKYDLESRGPGDFFGSRQHGLPTLKIADLNTDMRILNAAQNEASEIIKNDETLQKPENSGLKNLVNSLFKEDTALN